MWDLTLPYPSPPLQPAIRRMINPINAQSAALWGSTAVVGAIWLTQPFGWIKKQFESEEEK